MSKVKVGRITRVYELTEKGKQTVQQIKSMLALIKTDSKDGSKGVPAAMVNTHTF